MTFLEAHDDHTLLESNDDPKQRERKQKARAAQRRVQIMKRREKR